LDSFSMAVFIAEKNRGAIIGIEFQDFATKIEK
jgi:hypothetical protein